MGDCQFQAIFEQGTVRQAREQIVISLKVDKRLGFLALGNISGSSVVTGVLAIATSPSAAVVRPGLGVNGKCSYFKVSCGSPAATCFKAYFQRAGIVCIDIGRIQRVDSFGDITVVQNMPEMLPTKLNRLVTQ